MDSLEAIVVVAATGAAAQMAFGTALLATLALLRGGRYADQDDVMEQGLAILAKVLIWFGLLGFLLALLNILGVLLWIGVVVVYIQSRLKQRVSQQYALLSMLAVAAQRFVPLAAVFNAFAQEGRSLLARRARRMAEMLEAGVPFADALEQRPGLLPPETVPIVCLGYESGALAQGLRRAAPTRDLHAPLWGSLAAKILYVFIVILFLLAILTFVMAKIVPQFVKIYEDFEATLPTITQNFVFAFDFLGQCYFLLVPLCAAIGVVFFYAILRYVGLVRWEVPGTRGLTRRLHAATILDALALAAEYGRPFPDALASLSRSYPHAWVRRRLERVAREVAAGDPWSESLHRAGLLPKPDLAVLQSAQRVGNLPWAMREMADSGRRRAAYRLQMLLQILVPPVTLILGLLVFTFAVAMFLPIIPLIQMLS
jgi:protein transport protein HofC